MSTNAKGQDPSNQLREFAKHHGPIYKVYTDQDSGYKIESAEYKQLSINAYQQKIDLVVFGVLVPKGYC